jgi:aryl-alcohol dehydrogenase-like predicted oxidoreductase
MGSGWSGRAVTAHYNVGVRLGAGLLKVAGEHGIAYSPWHPAAIPAGEAGARHRAVLEPLATKYAATVHQVALAWQLHRSPRMLPIPGTTSVQHLEENLAAARITLQPDEVAAITALEPEND